MSAMREALKAAGLDGPRPTLQDTGFLVSEVKRCTNCDELKPKDEFYRISHRWLRNHCKACWRVTKGRSQA